MSLIDPFGLMAQDPNPAKNPWIRSLIDWFFGPGSSLPGYMNDTPFGTTVRAIDGGTERVEVAMGNFANGKYVEGSLQGVAVMGTAAGTALSLANGGRPLTGIVAKDGTAIKGFTGHGVDRAIGDTARRAGTRPQAILDALKNPKKIVRGVDGSGRPFVIYTGQNARVIVNPQTGKIVSVNPRSAAGAHGP